MCVFGFEDDADVAARVFEYTAKYVNRKAGNYVQKFTAKKLSTDGIKGDYILGFLQGLNEVWKEQNRHWQDGAMALMVVTPVEVKEAYQEREKNFQRKNWNNGIRQRGDRQARAAGYNDGQAYGEGHHGRRLSE